MSVAAFLFPGQGSQFVGMGRQLYERCPWARDIMTQAEEVTGKPITRLCFEGPLDELTLTVNLQPAVTAINLICLQALTERRLKPKYTAGHSLGEYSALAAAGVISFETALKLVNLRGELMHRDATAFPGAMQAIVGLSIEDVSGLVELAGDMGVVAVANHNSPKQVVVTGDIPAVAAAARLAQAKGAKTLALPVSGAWHSPLMSGAAEEFAGHLEEIEFKVPICPVFLNLTGRAATDPQEIKTAMARQMTSPVKWCDIIENMVADQVTAFVEVGPRNVLAGLVKKTVTSGNAIKVLNVEDSAGVEKAAVELGA